MTVLLTLTTAGVDTGPFDLYSNLDSFTVPFETNVSKLALETGYTTSLVPDYTTLVRVQSKEICTGFVDIPLYLASYPYTFQTGTDCPTACSAGGVVIFM